MKQRTLVTALGFGALVSGSCLVYDESDVGRGGRGSAAAGVGSTDGGTGGQGGSRPSGGSGKAGATGGIAAAGRSGAPPGGGGGGGGAGEGGSAAGEAGAEVGGSSSGRGGGGVSGTVGSGGAPTQPPELIDDCEDGNVQVLLNDRRNGYWYTFGDGTKGSSVVPDPKSMWMMELHQGSRPPPVDGNVYGFKIAMKGFAGWGAGAGVNFLAIKSAYDASAYDGIGFYARANKAMSLDVKLAVRGTDPSGGICDPAATAAANRKCENYHMKSQPIDDEWVWFEFTWSNFAQAPGWGQQVVFRPQDLFSLQFIVQPGYTTATAQHPEGAVVWIDNVQFLPSEPGPVQ